MEEKGIITKFDVFKGLVAREEAEHAENVHTNFLMKTWEDFVYREELLASSETSKSLVRTRTYYRMYSVFLNLLK